MTNLEKQEAEEKKRDIIISQGNCCSVCGKEFSFSNIPAISHRLIKSKPNLKLYGAEIIHHRFNLRATCYGNCNDAVIINRATKPVEAMALIESIKADILAK